MLKDKMLRLTLMIKKIFLTLFVFLFFCSASFAESFYIKNYDVGLKVDNTKKVHVTETIDAFFTRKSHGIFRDIPAPNAEVTNIEVSEKNKVTQSADKYSIQIGDANKYITGDHIYKISYDYRFLDNKNELYFNIIGTDWETNINRVSFKVEMPDKIEDEKTGLSIGRRGTEGFSEGEGQYKVTEKYVIGETLRNLDPKEGITIRIEVPQGYFVTNFASKQNISLYLMLLSTLACIILWFIYGKDEKPIPVVSFYPPEKMNALDVELAYNEGATTKGIVAMIVDLAQRGYLKITDNEDGFVIEKAKIYDGSDNDERTLINAIFNGVKLTATEQHLKKSTTFYKAVEKIIEEKNKERDKLYEPIDANKNIRKTMQYIIGFLGVVVAFACASFSLWNIFQGLLIAGLYLLVQWFIFLCVEDIRNKTLAVIVSNLIIIFPFYIGFLAMFETMLYAYPICILGYFCILLSTLCYDHMRKRSRQTLVTLGELEGLKKFIKTAEMNKLQMLVDENPQYFYNILPYAYIFDLSNKWIKKFENIVKPNYAWSSGTSFNNKEFIYFTKTMKQLSVPSYTNGGITYSSSSGSYHSHSHGGGGDSGGGGGGGGGHSW